eukprot:gene8065-1304_t
MHALTHTTKHFPPHTRTLADLGTTLFRNREIAIFRSYKGDGVTTGVTSDDGAVPSEAPARAAPSDAEVLAMLRTVRLESVLLRYDTQGTGGLSALDKVIDWAASLSLGEQQRLAWARLLLARPKLALMDEATSALDTNLEMQLYDELERSGITYVSVGHRPTLKEFHRKMLEVLPKDKDGGTVAASWEENEGGTIAASWELSPKGMRSDAYECELGYGNILNLGCAQGKRRRYHSSLLRASACSIRICNLMLMNVNLVMAPSLSLGLPKENEGGTIAASWELKPLAKGSAV